MTPTVLQFVGSANVNKYSTVTTVGQERCVSSFYLDEIIYPPKNVAGKQCLVEATYCNFETVKPLSSTDSANQRAYFGWNMNSLWSQLYNKSNAPMITPAFGVRDLATGLYYDLGPRVIQISDGPFPVRFTCYQQNPSRRLTTNYYPSDRYTALGTSPYASVAIITGTNDTLIIDGTTITIPGTASPGTTYSSITAMYNVLNPLMPTGFILRTDGNTSNTRLGITRIGSTNFTIGGTARTTLGFSTGAAYEAADTTDITVVLNLTPIE